MPTKKIVPTTESTQTNLKSLLQKDPNLPHLSFVQALEQTQGRGRQGNQWISKPGNLYLSVLYRYGDQTSTVAKHLTWMPLWVGMQVRQALVDLGLLAKDLALKWPNDLYFQARAKFGGILCEKIQQNLVIGIGMNVAHSPQGELPEGRVATSLQEIGASIAVDSLRDAVLNRLAHPFDLERLKQELLQHMIPGIGAEVHWVDQIQGVEKSGIVLGLGGFGELQVVRGDLKIDLFSEEVSLIRAGSPSGAISR